MEEEPWLLCLTFGLGLTDTTLLGFDGSQIFRHAIEWIFGVEREGAIRETEDTWSRSFAVVPYLRID